jgi:uncharacterized protein (DUF58 family)
VGEPLALRVQAAIAGRRGGAAPVAALGFDPRLGSAGRAACALEQDGERGGWAGACRLVPQRRGTAALGEVWLRWTGPLGLGQRQARQALDRSIRIWPNLAPVRSPLLQTYLRQAQFGLIARRIRGEGSEFESLAEYQPGMDRRRIEWKSSARHARLYAREYETERNNQIVFAFDCGQAMCEPVDGLPRIDRAVSAALTAAYVALRGGDRVSLFGFAARPEVASPFIADAGAFHRLQAAAAGLDYHGEEPNFTLAMATLTARLRRRSLIVLFSDFTDPTSAELMIESVGRLVRHHLVVFVTMEDSELAKLAEAEPESLRSVAMAVGAGSLSRHRALVLQRLRQQGVDVIEAPWRQIGFRLIDRYLEIKQKGAIG